ncbi:MAG: P-loop NTPase [candidate division Zixibacteria bacterium]|nr:P-loop NTPase [candidate division Zixibacteria bacterium]
MAIEEVTGIALLSGKGGVGKSVIALNLALSLGSLGMKTILLDVGSGDLVNLTNSGNLNCESDGSNNFNLTDNVNLYCSSIAHCSTILGEKDVEDFLAEIVSVVQGNDFAIFDCPTGVGPIPYTLAGLSEIPVIVSTPEPTSIAGAYILARSLYREELAQRCGILFNRVDSADMAASLETRFDILTSQFLHFKFNHAGFIHDDRHLALSVLEQQPFFLSQHDCPARSDFLNLARICRLKGKLQNETERINCY